MSDEPKGGSLPIIAGGALMVVCCAAPVLFGVGGASVLAWFSGFSAGEIGAVAGLAALVFFGVVKFWKASPNPASDETDRHTQ